MDSFEIVKAEKGRAMRRYRQIGKIAIFFRFVEVFLAIFFLFTWYSSHLPIDVKISGDFFRHLFVFLISPRFVFFFVNAIILTLLAKSGQLSGQNSAGKPSVSDLYDEFLKNSESSQQKVRTEEEIVYVDKTVCVESTNTGSDTKKKEYRRSVSEGSVAEKKAELRRSETDIRRKVEKSGERATIISSADGEMSNEEFRRTIEAFIAKQLKFQREESMAIVWTNQI